MNGFTLQKKGGAGEYFLWDCREIWDNGFKDGFSDKFNLSLEHWTQWDVNISSSPTSLLHLIHDKCLLPTRHNSMNRFHTSLLPFGYVRTHSNPIGLNSNLQGRSHLLPSPSPSLSHGLRNLKWGGVYGPFYDVSSSSSNSLEGALEGF